MHEMFTLGLEKEKNFERDARKVGIGAGSLHQLVQRYKGAVPVTVSEIEGITMQEKRFEILSFFWRMEHMINQYKKKARISRSKKRQNADWEEIAGEERDRGEEKKSRKKKTRRKNSLACAFAENEGRPSCDKNLLLIFREDLEEQKKGQEKKRASVLTSESPRSPCLRLEERTLCRAGVDLPATLGCHCDT